MNPVTERAWAAGFFDAEGCVTGFIPGGSLRKPCGRNRRLYLEVTQACTAEHLERFRRAVDFYGTVIGPTYRKSRPGSNPMFRWQTSGEEAHVVMGMLRPYLCSPKIAKYEEMRKCEGVELVGGDHLIRDRGSEVAWAAGFFDGEGCVSGYTTHFPTRTVRYIALIVAQTSTEHLERFKLAVGAGSIQRPVSGKKPHHKPMYRWQKAGKDAHAVMELLRPFLCSPKLTKYDVLKVGAA